MLLPLSALYYKADDYPKAEEYLEKLEKINPETKQAFHANSKRMTSRICRRPARRISTVPESSEEIILAIVDAAFFISVNGRVPGMGW
jgi:RNase P subunit RPR2